MIFQEFPIKESLIKYVKNQTNDDIYISLEDNDLDLRFIRPRLSGDKDWILISDVIDFYLISPLFDYYEAGNLIKYIKNPSKELIIYLTKTSVQTINYLPPKFENDKDIWDVALSCDDIWEDIVNPSKEFILYAISTNPPKDKICKLVSYVPKAMNYLPDKLKNDREIWYSVLDCENLFEWLENPSREFILYVISQYPKFIYDLGGKATYDYWSKAIELEGQLIKDCPYYSEELEMLALKSEKSGFKYIRNLSGDMCLDLITGRPEYLEPVLEYILKTKPELKYVIYLIPETTWIDALREDGRIIRFHPNPSKTMRDVALNSKMRGYSYVEVPPTTSKFESIFKGLI